MLMRPGFKQWSAEWLLAWLIGFLILTREAHSNNCPKKCFCNTISHIVYCSRRGLPFIPEGVPRDSLQLNLNGNVFQTPIIQRSNFSSYVNLEHLYLSECGIENIEVETFVDLTNLKWLDLSYNRIKVVQDFTFRGLHLEHLFLNGNRNIQIHPKSFSGLETTGLYLHDCSLTEITVDVLAPLNSTLKYLWLNGNQLERLDKKMAPTLKTLSHMRLAGNPFHCNCEVIWLKEFYDNNVEIFKGAEPPSCLTPIKLAGKFFNQLSQDDFRCRAPVFNNIDAVFNEHQGRLRCTATGDPAPTMFWIQPSGTSRRYEAPKEEDARHNEGILTLNPDGNDSDLSGMYICLAYNEAGNVTLTMNVAWPGKTATRTEGTSTPPASSSTSNGGNTEEGEGTHHSKHNRNRNHNHEKVHSTHIDSNQADSPLNGHKDSDESSINPLDEDGSKKDTNANSAAKGDKSYNFTALNMMDLHKKKGDRLFNLTELVGAIIGTHVCTLLLCLIFMPIYLKRQWKKRRHQNQGLEKNPNETAYLNGRGIPDYLDTPTLTHKR